MRMRTGRMLAALLGILAVAVFAPQLASADTSTGALSGTVTNAAGQDIAGVQVTVTNVGTGNSYSATTAADATYTASGLRDHLRQGHGCRDRRRPERRLRLRLLSTDPTMQASTGTARTFRIRRR
jgi:carboxypeptidase family protein